MATTTRTSLDVINGLRDVWIKHRAENAVMTWLSAFGLTHHQVTKLIEELGASCMEALKANPYAIIPAIRGFGFKKVDKIARRMGAPKEHPERIRAGTSGSVPGFCSVCRTRWIQAGTAGRNSAFLWTKPTNWPERPAPSGHGFTGQPHLD